MKRIDLHTHSRCSDGTLSPAGLVERAREAGLAALALTDHDGMDGRDEFASASQGVASAWCGIEINTRISEVHVLGYGMRADAAGFRAWLGDLRRRRVRRVERILERLAAIGYRLSLGEVLDGGVGVVGRPHVADALCRKGMVGSRGEAFGRFLARGRPAYVESLGPTPEEAIDAIRQAGGIPVLAHPDTVEDLALVKGWAALGLEGLEAYYTGYAPAKIAAYAALASGLGLLVTGGSDLHGPGTSRDYRLGVDVPDDVLARFEERLSRCG